MDLNRVFIFKFDQITTASPFQNTSLVLATKIALEEIDD